MPCVMPKHGVHACALKLLCRIEMHHAQIYAVLSTILINEQIREAKFATLKKRAKKRVFGLKNLALTLAAGNRWISSIPYYC